jgi:DnaJ-class molecular chaperone
VTLQQAAAPTAQAPPRKTYIHTTRRAPSSSTTSRAAAAQGRSAQQAAYTTIGLQPGASLQEVRRAYKQLAVQLHPDKWVLAAPEQQAAAEAQFKQIAGAYQCLLEVAQP